MILGRYRFSKPENFKSMQITYKDKFDKVRKSIGFVC